jgi:CheY-like chemotaxis protein
MIDTTYTVLIVDDSSANREYLSHVLEEDGYRTVGAADGEAGLSAAARERPILILLDVIMPA